MEYAKSPKFWILSKTQAKTHTAASASHVEQKNLEILPSNKKPVIFCHLTHLQAQLSLGLFIILHQIIPFELHSETETIQILRPSCNTLLQLDFQPAHLFLLIAITREHHSHKHEPKENPRTRSSKRVSPTNIRTYGSVSRSTMLKVNNQIVPVERHRSVTLLIEQSLAPLEVAKIVLPRNIDQRILLTQKSPSWSATITLAKHDI